MLVIRLDKMVEPQLVSTSNCGITGTMTRSQLPSGEGIIPGKTWTSGFLERTWTATAFSSWLARQQLPLRFCI